MNDKQKNNIEVCYEYQYDGSFPPPESALPYFAKAASIAEQAQSFPKTLRQLGTERILHRKVIEWCDHLGSYGMGGPGFFGIKLASTEQYAEEWLVLIVWQAAHWLLLDGRWFAADPSQYPIQKPLYSSFVGDRQWDKVSGILIGAVVANAVVEDDASLICLQKDNQEHRLEIPRDASKLPVRVGNNEPRVWYKHESQLDAWVVIPAEAELLLCGGSPGARPGD